MIKVVDNILPGFIIDIDDRLHDHNAIDVIVDDCVAGRIKPEHRFHLVFIGSGIDATNFPEISREDSFVIRGDEYHLQYTPNSCELAV